MSSGQPPSGTWAAEPPSAEAGDGPDSPAATIIIPVFNQCGLTRQCLATLAATLPPGGVEVLVVDNGSSEETAQFLRHTAEGGGLRLQRNHLNLGFARACNQGAALARGEFLLFLNNDTRPIPGWFEAMLAAGRGAQVGAVGAKLLYEDGRIQHAGIGFVGGIPDHPHRHTPADAEEVNRVRELDMVSGACLLVRRSLFLALGGFDECYQNGFDDVDLCLRLRAADYKVVYEPAAVLYHLEGQTTGRFAHVQENLKRFFHVWRGWFDSDNRFLPPQPPKLILPERSLLLEKAHLAEVDWDGPFLDPGSLSHVNRELTAALRRRPGLQLHLVGRNTLAGPWAHLPEFQAVAMQLQVQPSDHPHVTVRHGWPPNWTRPNEGALVLIQPWDFGALPRAWVEEIRHVDQIWVPSEHVRRVYLESGVPAAKIQIVPNGIDPEKFQPGAFPVELPTKKRFKFLYVGGNIPRQGPDLLLQAYLSSFSSADDVCLVIKDLGGPGVNGGQTLADEIQRAQAEPGAPEILHLTRDLVPSDLPGLYTACDCLVHPYRGEGFGLPVLEAMACGLPVIVTSGGATDDFAAEEYVCRIPATSRTIGNQVAGVKLTHEAWWLEPDRAALGEQMRWVHTHRAEARQKGLAASQFARREWSWDRAADVAARLLRQLATCQPARTAPALPDQAALLLPPAARLGALGPARSFLRQGQYVPAWNAAVVALEQRPFHPEAYLLLAEIALAGGDFARAKECVARSEKLAPKWKPARKFLKKHRPQPGLPRVAFPALPAHHREPRLSVCLITRNEERFLRRCLQSVRDLAWQIVVLDTGSTDGTLDIACEFGVDLAQAIWTDDFSAARNAALERARGDWVLVLDADEELYADSRESLRRHLHASGIMAFRLPIADQGSEEEGCHYVPRLFRNAPGLFFVGRVHEQIFGSLEVCRREWGLANELGQARLLHHGYAKEIVRERDKVARNLRLLEQAVRELPTEPQLLMSLGLELVRSGRRSEGLERYWEAYRALSSLPPDQVVPELRESLLTQFIAQLLAVKDFSSVVRVLRSPLAKIVPLSASLHFGLGLALFELRQCSEAAEQFRQCLAKRDQPTLASPNREIRGAAPRHCLALCLHELKETAAAAQAFREAVAEDPHSGSLHHDYALFLCAQGKPLDALEVLRETIGRLPDDPHPWLAGGQIALSQPDFIEFARDWTSEAVKHLPDHEQLLLQRAEALLLSQQTSQALPLWRQAGRAGDPKHLAARVLCELAEDQPFLVTRELELETSQEFLRWYRRLLQFNAASLVLLLNERLHQLQEALPSAAQTLQAVLIDAQGSGNR